MIAADKAQYEKDWNNWPTDEGAPYDDVNGDGVYTPGTWSAENNAWVGDIPGIPGLTKPFGQLQTTYQMNMQKVVLLVFLKMAGVLLLSVLRCN